MFGTLGEERYFLRGIAAHVGIEGPGLLGDDLVTELGCGLAQRIGEEPVAWAWSLDQEPALPLPLQKEHRKGVREHVSARQGVQDVRTAILAAQLVVRRTGVEEE
ncbi:MAG: hypothetical protein R3C97_02895 [Geminicoccaceae bacterium]